MSLLKTLRKLILGETWLLPAGLAVCLLVCGLVLKPALGGGWSSAGGFVLLAGVLATVLAAVSRG